MLKVFKYDTIIRLNHGLRKLEQKGHRIKKVEFFKVRDVVYPEYSTVADRIEFYVLVELTKGSSDSVED